MLTIRQEYDQEVCHLQTVCTRLWNRTPVDWDEIVPSFYSLFSHAHLVRNAFSALQEADANKRLKRTTKIKKLSRKVKESLAQRKKGFAITEDEALSDSYVSANNAHPTNTSTEKYF